MWLARIAVVSIFILFLPVYLLGLVLGSIIIAAGAGAGAVTPVMDWLVNKTNKKGQ